MSAGLLTGLRPGFAAVQGAAFRCSPVERENDAAACRCTDWIPPLPETALSFRSPPVASPLCSPRHQSFVYHHLTLSFSSHRDMLEHPTPSGTPRLLIAVERAQLLIHAPLRSPAFELVARTHINELGVLGETRMDLADEAEHLLGDPPVVGVSLGRGPELAEVVNLPKVDAEVPADPKRQRHGVLREGRPDVALQSDVGGGGGLDRGSEAALHAELGQASRTVVAESGTEKLPVLGEHPVPVEVAVSGEVGDDLEGVLGMLERARRSLPAVGAAAEDR